MRRRFEAEAVCQFRLSERPVLRESALYAINHPPGMENSDPITSKLFKIEACDNPTPMGYNCRFDWQVATAGLVFRPARSLASVPADPGTAGRAR